MMTRLALSAGVLLVVVASPGCGSDTDGPPDVRFGEAVCDECGMMLSDERFGYATMIDGDRGREPLVFDDSICQHNYEMAHPDLVILDRWAHDYNTKQWIPQADAFCVRSDKIKAPMGSNVGFFGTRAEAESFAKDLDAQVIPFAQLWDGKD